MSEHGGQVALPGGRVEPGENSRTAALREMQEELGVRADDVEVLGPLSPIHLFVSHYAVQPWLALASAAPIFEPHPYEVAQVLELPAAKLTHPEQGRYVYRRFGLEFSAPCLFCEGHAVWGATALILGELAGLLREVGDD